jgi:hypothetical protein
MTLIVIGTVHGGERDGAPIGFMKREGVCGRQPEEEEERGVQPVGLPNIDNNCHVSAAIYLAAIERGYNEVTNTQLWEHANNHTGRKGSMQGEDMAKILSAMEREKVPGVSSGDALAILDHLRGREGCLGQGWYWECRCGWEKFEKTDKGVVRIEGKLRAGGEVNSKLQGCERCKRLVAEKKLGVEETQQTVVISGGAGLWEGGLDQGVWVQGRKGQHWFQTVGALVWKENGVRKRAKVRKTNEGEGSGKGHFTALRLVHDVWWECDDESVKRYRAGADEGEEGEIRAVVLQKMKNDKRIARDGGEPAGTRPSPRGERGGSGNVQERERVVYWYSI